MPTIEFDDQFVLEPAAPVRERYDTAAILRRNIADLEIALKQQTERAEAAEAELEAVREDNHAMMLEIDGMRTEMTKLREQKPVAFWWIGPDGKDNGGPYRGKPSDSAIDNARNMGCEPQLLFAGPVSVPAAPAPSVPAEWREVMAELVADLQSACDAEHPHRDQYPSVMRKYNNDMEIVEKARALLQSAEVRHD